MEYITTNKGTVLPMASVKGFKPGSDSTGTVILLKTGEQIADNRTMAQLIGAVYGDPTSELEPIVNSFTNFAESIERLSKLQEANYKNLESTLTKQLQKVTTGLAQALDGVTKVSKAIEVVAEEHRATIEETSAAGRRLVDSTITLQKLTVELEHTLKEI